MKLFKYTQVKNLTKPWREISDPSGQLISQVRRCI